MSSRVQLRKHMRVARRELSAAQRRAAAKRLASSLAKNPRFRRALRVAVFFANDGEMDLSLLVRHAWKTGKSCYLPLVRGKHARTMRFAAYRPGRRLRRNRFGIPEPFSGAGGTLSARELDLVLVPLVAYDNLGHRVGMGGGFYDRTLACVHRRHSLRKPYLMGIAYEFQRVPEIEAQPWDVPLHAVCTERGVSEF